MCKVSGHYVALTDEEKSDLYLPYWKGAFRSSCNDEPGLPNFNLRYEHLHEVLRDNSFISDEIINAYFSLLWFEIYEEHKEKSVFFFNTYFFAILAKDFEKAVLFKGRFSDYDLIFMPVHVHGNHWTLYVIDPAEQEIRYYDSLGGVYAFGDSLILRFLRHWSSSPGNWTIKRPVTKLQEKNDCGIFVLRYAVHESHDLPIDFGQDEISLFRPRVVYDIFVAGKITL